MAFQVMSRPTLRPQINAGSVPDTWVPNIVRVASSTSVECRALKNLMQIKKEEKIIRSSNVSECSFS